MPQIKFAKTDNINIFDKKSTIITEDKLYICKENKNFGRIFYDYDDNTRIEIGSLNHTYTCVRPLINDIENVKSSDLRKYISPTNSHMSVARCNEIQLNSLVTSDKTIYCIKNIDYDKQIITLIKIYKQQDLKWNDYYE